MSGKVKENKDLHNALDLLKRECEAYIAYLDRQIDGEQLPSDDPLMQKKEAVAAIFQILNNTTISDNNTKGRLAVNAYFDKQKLFIRSPDEVTTRIFKAIAYVIVSLATGFAFNLGRMAYRYVEGNYVGYSIGFNSEKFAKNAEMQISEIREKARGGFDEEQDYPTEPIIDYTKLESNKTQTNTNVVASPATVSSKHVGFLRNPTSRGEAIKYWRAQPPISIPGSAESTCSRFKQTAPIPTIPGKPK